MVFGLLIGSPWIWHSKLQFSFQSFTKLENIVEAYASKNIITNNQCQMIKSSITTLKSYLKNQFYHNLGMVYVKVLKILPAVTDNHCSTIASNSVKWILTSQHVQFLAPNFGNKLDRYSSGLLNSKYFWSKNQKTNFFFKTIQNLANH